MEVSGSDIAQSIYQKQARLIKKLDQHKIKPLLATLVIGHNPATDSYIGQKAKFAEIQGIRFDKYQYDETVKPAEIEMKIKRLNTDSAVHGLIIQRPVPVHIKASPVLSQISPSKDVDGFIPNSPFTPPVAQAAVEILKKVKNHLLNDQRQNDKRFWYWLRQKQIAIVGRGESAGKPISDCFLKHKCATSQIHSHTPDPDKILSRSDIIISCVGKKGVIKPDNITKGVILISVGICRDEQGFLHGDYEVGEVSDIASFYTPTPGGVGPVNVACLLGNVVKAAIKQSGFNYF